METLIICNNQKKEKILNDLNSKPMMHVSFMTKKDFIHNYYFDYNKETIYYLTSKYHYKYDIALEYLSNLYYVENKEYGIDKLDSLVSLKQELDNEGLLVYNPLFKEYLKNKKIVFMDYLSKFDLHMINELGKLYDIEIKSKEINYYDPIVYSFKTIDEEVEYVAYQIAKLIDDGISPDKIKIANVGSDYDYVIKRIFNMYHLNICDKKCLYGMNITKDFINHYSENISDTIDYISSKYDSQLVNKIINIINNYSFIDNYQKVKYLIIEDIKRTYLKTNYLNQIEIVDYKDSFDDEYIFLMNFNEESIPLKYQDIDYINDNIKPDYLDNTIDKNKLENDIVRQFIRGTKNLVITYKLKTPFASFYPSSLIEELNLTVRQGQINELVSYSNDMGLIKTCQRYDDYYKYGVKRDDLELLSSNYPINYQNYSNKFSGINRINEPFTLSYTSMDSYFKCSFKYYLDRVLKIDINTNEMAKYIGSIMHYVLEKGLDTNIHYHHLVKEYLNKNNITLTFKERFFLDKLCSELPHIMEEIKKQDKYIKLTKRLYEEKVEVDFNNCKFMGVIDKVLYDNDLYAIVDYKTGHTDINISHIKDGLGMQLPVYLYLAHKKFGGHVVGFYLNQILHGNIKYDLKKNYDQLYKDNLKLYGYSNEKYISDFDSSYKDSQIIKSLKIKNDGNFYNTSKVLSELEIDEMIEIVEEKIIECIEKIENNKFDINPKNIGSKNVSCEYCPYSSICFKTNDDIVYLKEEDHA